MSDDSSRSSVEAIREDTSAVKNEGSQVQALGYANIQGQDTGSRESLSPFQSKMVLGSGQMESFTLQQANLQRQAIHQQQSFSGGPPKRNRAPHTNFSQFKTKEASSGDQMQEYQHQNSA